MRDIALTLIFLPMLLISVRFVHTATMVWIWTALAAPASFLFGFAATLPLNKIAVGATLVSVVADRTKRKFIADPTFVFHSLFILQAIITYAMSLTDIPRSYDLLDKLVKIWILTLFMRVANRDRLQLHALIIMVTLSLGLHGLLEGLKYALTAGAHKVTPVSTLGDNNSFALATLMMLPFFYYLYQHSKTRLMQLGFASMGLTAIVGVIASASRGALIGLVVLALMMVMQSKRRIAGIFIAILLGLTLFALAPDRWTDRMSTIRSAENDGSFMSRVASWKLHTIVALNRPLTGGGFSCLEDPHCYSQFIGQFGMLDFIPSEQPVGVLAAHSLYFEVIGDTGFIGFFLYMSMLATWFLNNRRTKRLTRGDPSRRWAFDFAAALERSLAVYLVSGAALSVAYFENVFIELTMASVLYASVRESLGVTTSKGIMSSLHTPGAGVPAVYARR